jgi:isocitrate dehydrogenase
VHNAWLRTIEDGVHTYDIFDESVSKEKVGTKEFGQAVVQRLGKKPHTLKAVAYKQNGGEGTLAEETIIKERSDTRKELVGVDVFLDWMKGSPDNLGRAHDWNYAGRSKADDDQQSRRESLAGRKIRNVLFRSLALPLHAAEWFDHQTTTDSSKLLSNVAAAGFDFIKTENLCNFDGERGYSLDQGE